MRDVAAASGASLASISALLNGTARVGPDTARRIREAIEQTGYRHNAVARSLKTGISKTIGMVVTDVTNPFFTDLVAALQPRLQAAGYAAMLSCGAGEADDQRDDIALLLQRQVDGLVLAPSADDASVRKVLAAPPVPVVLVDRTLPGAGIDSVAMDNHAAAFQLTTHVIGCGHRRIAHVSGPVGTSTGRERREGHLAALAAAGIPGGEEATCDGGFREDGGRRAASDLLAGPDRPTAIFAANNQMAIGVMRALRDAGLSCPDDVSVACIDDFPWAEAFNPRLTTVAQPVEEMAAQVTAMLLDRLGPGRDAPAREVRVPGRLIVRDSIALIGKG